MSNTNNTDSSGEILAFKAGQEAENHCLFCDVKLDQENIALAPHYASAALRGDFQDHPRCMACQAKVDEESRQLYCSALFDLGLGLAKSFMPVPARSPEEEEEEEALAEMYRDQELALTEPQIDELGEARQYRNLKESYED